MSKLEGTVDIKTIAPTYYNLPKEKQEAIERAYDSGQHVYFVKAKGLDLVKIGIAKEPTKRLKAMQIGSPVHLMLLLVNSEIKEIIEEIKQLLREEQWLNQLALET